MKMGMMENVLKISELISTDVRSRCNAGIIRSAIDGLEGRIILDFEGVTFVSRSFTDELCSIMEEKQNCIEVVNAMEEVKSMIDAVSSGRKQKRKRVKDDSEIKEFADIESLTSFLATI